MLPEPLFHSLILMNPGIVILEYARAMKEKYPLMKKKLAVQYTQIVI